MSRWITKRGRGGRQMHVRIGSIELANSGDSSPVLVRTAEAPNAKSPMAPRAAPHRARPRHRAKARKAKRAKRDTGIQGAADERAKGVGGKGSWNDWGISDAKANKIAKKRRKQGFLFA